MMTRGESSIEHSTLDAAMYDRCKGIWAEPHQQATRDRPHSASLLACRDQACVLPVNFVSIMVDR
jgi:hypothetical protein